MGGLFGSGGGKVDPPKPIPPPALPVVGEEVGDIARKNRPRGFKDLFLTGELVPDTGKKKVLG